MQNKSVH